MRAAPETSSMKRIFIRIGFLNLLLGSVTIVVIGADPGLLWGLRKWVIAANLIGFLLTWPLAVIVGLVYQVRLGTQGNRILTDEMYCLGCGYSLRGLEQQRCPECGRSFDPDNWRTFRSEFSQSQPNWITRSLWIWICLSGFGAVVLFLYGIMLALY
jgi:hypothetical protein